MTTRRDQILDIVKPWRVVPIKCQRSKVGDGTQLTWWIVERRLPRGSVVTVNGSTGETVCKARRWRLPW